MTSRPPTTANSHLHARNTPRIRQLPQAINCDRLKQIPADYTGQIGVPITYLLHHNPNQFKIIGFSSQLAQPTRVNGKKVTTDFVIDNVRKYTRAVIQARH